MGILSGKTAVVTGGSSGFGAGMSESLREAGAVVWITGRNEERLGAVAEKIGARYFAADITDGSGWDKLMNAVTGETGGIDILVNNAGGGVRIAPLEDQQDDDIGESISVNLTGALLGCRRVAPIMKKQRSGTIINVSSVCAREAWPGWSVYSAAKAGLVQFSRCLYTELRDYGVRVTSLIPSWGATNFLVSAGLKPFDDDTKSKAIQPGDLGTVVVNICGLPPHLVIEDMTVWPLVQEVVPL